jgi:ABC-type lipoprotein export system ATPase subunit
VAAGNILMIGSSGTGKTTLMRAVEVLLASTAELAAASTAPCASIPPTGIAARRLSSPVSSPWPCRDPASG